MSWYIVSLSTEQIEFGFVDIITAEVAEIWLARGGPADFSVWLQADVNPARIFFSAIAAEACQSLLFRFGGQPCPDPDLKNLQFLVGTAYHDN